MVHFLTHMVLGSVLFIAIALIAFGLGEFVKVLELRHASAYLVFVLTGVEYALVTGDALCFLVLVGKAMYKTAKETEL